MLVDPLPGGKIPDGLRLVVGIEPESGRLPEVAYPTERDASRGQVGYKTAVRFDRDEFWRVRLILSSSQGDGEVLSRVEATPPRFGCWDLLLYLLPFLLVARLWLRGISRHHRRKLQTT